MLKWVLALLLIAAVLSVAGCCCCSSLDRGYSYSTVKQDQASTSCTCDTPYDCAGCGTNGVCTCQK